MQHLQTTGKVDPVKCSVNEKCARTYREVKHHVFRRYGEDINVSYAYSNRAMLFEWNEHTHTCIHTLICEEVDVSVRYTSRLPCLISRQKCHCRLHLRRQQNWNFPISFSRFPPYLKHIHLLNQLPFQFR